MKITMPQIDEAMSEGMISEWLKQDGEPVQKGEALVMISSGKTESELEAPASGIVKIYAEADLDNFIACGKEIGEIVEA